MNSQLLNRFEQAAATAQKLASRPDNDTLKQSTSGDAAGKRPALFDVVGRAKFDIPSSTLPNI